MNNELTDFKKAEVNITTKDIVITGLLIAMVFVSTRFISLRLPISVNGGLIHFGNAALFIASIVFGKKKGALAGAFGMGLFDVVSGWMAWAPFTFVIRGIMGYMVGVISNARGKNGKSAVYNMMAILAASVWMVAGYYMTEVILYKNWFAPITSIPGNLTQIALGLIVGLPIATLLQRNKALSNIL
ncbi:MAG: ECF transporter S component [Clostridia bacterium]|nr:ECF transporter S component [Clostridia bacterium]